MSLLNIFKKNPTKQNTYKNTSPVTPHKNTHMPFNTFVHEYAILDQDSSLFVEYENGEIVSTLRFSVYKDELKICDFLAGGKDTNYHHGTELIIALLRHLNHRFTKIHGTLSPNDAFNKNWNRSIPFYADLPKYIFSRMGLNYRFYLFDDEHYKVDVTDSIINASDRDVAVEQFRQEHLFNKEGQNKTRFGSFHYILQ